MCSEAITSIADKSGAVEIVGSAADSENALARIATLKPEIVLMDIRLPGALSGIEVTARLAQAYPEIKVIILTNCQDEESLHSAIDAGAAGYLLKSEIHDPAIILQAIQAVHHGKGYITPTITEKIITTLKNYRKYNDQGLTKREREILIHISQGKNNRLIAEELNIHERTVANHVSNILFKINAKNRTEAAAFARKTGIVT